jgi:type IV pilus assembly protein PilX
MEQDVMNTRYPRARRAPSCKSQQRGVVLFIALIVMVAMSLAAIALMRSVDTTSAVIGNLAFRQASILPANFGIEDAAAGLFLDANVAGVPRIADVRLDTPAENYYATHSQAAGWDDQYGIPLPLQTKAAAAALVKKQVDGAGNTITYVTERMCNPNAPTIPADKAAAGTWCDMMPPKQSPGTTINDPMAAIISAQPFYRVTVRVDGQPGTNTVSFAQAMLR